MMPERFDFVICLYLLARDNAAEYARQLEAQCRALCRDSETGISLDIRLGVVSGRADGLDGMLRLTRLTTSGGGRQSPVFESKRPGTNCADCFLEFVTWANTFDDSASQDAARILLISGHGNPARGLVTGVNHDAASPAPNSAEVAAEVTADGCRADDGALNVRQMNRILTATLPLLAVRQFSHDAARLRVAARRRFDVVVLHACTLGLVEAAYELRHVTRTVIACPVAFSHRMNLTAWFRRGITRHRSPEALARFLLHQEKTARLLPQANFAMIAVRVSDAPGEFEVAAAWKNLIRAINRVCAALRSGASSRIIAERLCQIHDLVPDSAIRRGSVRDLVLLARQTEDAVHATVPPGVSEFLSRDMEDALRQLQIDDGICLGSARTEFFSRNMAIHFPDPRSELFIHYRPPYPGGDDDAGFELLDQIDWVPVLMTAAEVCDDVSR